MNTTLNFTSPRLGQIPYCEEDVLLFESGLIGYPSCQHFLLVEHPRSNLFRWLQCLDEPGLAFLVTDPGNFVEDYGPQLSDEYALALDLTEDTERLVYTIVTIPKGMPEEMTINLAGPVVINVEARVAMQVVVDEEECLVKFPVFQSIGSQKQIAA